MGTDTQAQIVWGLSILTTFLEPLFLFWTFIHLIHLIIILLSYTFEKSWPKSCFSLSFIFRLILVEFRQVRWDHRMCRLHLGKSAKPCVEAPCWLEVVTLNAWGRDPGDGATLDPANKWSLNLWHSTWALTWLHVLVGKPDRINQWVTLSSSTYIIIPTVFFKLHLWQTSTLPSFILKVLEGGCWESTLLRWQCLKPFSCVQTHE